MQNPSPALDNYYNTTPLQRGTADVRPVAAIDVFPIPGGSPFAHTPQEKRIKQTQKVAEATRPAGDPASVRERAIVSATNNAYDQFRQQQESAYTLDQVAAMAQYSLQIGRMIEWERGQATGGGAV